MPLNIKQNWTRSLSYWHSWRETRRRKTCSISNNNTTDILMWLTRRSHLMDAVSGGVRTWMGWGVGCACAVWVTWGIDRVRLHTVSIPRRRQTLWTSGSCLIQHLYTCPTAECKEKACECFSWELVSCSWKCVTEVFRLLVYSRLLDLWA